MGSLAHGRGAMARGEGKEHVCMVACNMGTCVQLGAFGVHGCVVPWRMGAWARGRSEGVFEGTSPGDDPHAGTVDINIYHNT